MRIGEFGLEIRGANGLGVSKPENDGYVSLSHGEQYSLWLINDSPDRVNLYIKIDGLSVGDFQVSPYARVSLGRPLDGSGRFTFFQSGTGEAVAVGEASVAGFDKGLVEVAFVPEVRRPPPAHLGGYVSMPGQHTNKGVTRGGPCGQSASDVAGSPVVQTSYAMNFAPGVTGMTGHSSQVFGVASAIVEDLSRKVVITLRLIVAVVASGPAPLPGRRSNPVPAPVG